MDIYKSKATIVATVSPTISDGIINIYGFAEYHIHSLVKWLEKGSDWLCIDAGNDLYVRTIELKKYI